MEIYHFSRTRVPHQFCHRGTIKVEIGQLKKIMWYSSMVNSSTMQHNTRVYQARVPFYNKMLFFSIVLKHGELDYLVKFYNKMLFFFYSTRAHQARVPCKLFFFGLSTNKHKHKNK